MIRFSLSLLLLAFLAVVPPPTRWTVDGALKPTLTHLDRDGNRRVTKGEFQAVAYASPPFEEVDGNHDGALSTQELEAQIRQHDPLTFDGTALRPSNEHAPPAPVVTKQQLQTHEMVALGTVLIQQLEAVAPQVSHPTLKKWLLTGNPPTLENPRRQEVLRQLKTAYETAGMSFPGGLVLAETPPATGK